MPNTKPDSRTAFINATKKGRINEEDAQLAIEFVEYYTTIEKLTDGSEEKYLYCLKPFLAQIRIIGKKVAFLDEKGVLELMRWLHNSDWSEHTRADYWDRFTRFYAWTADRAADRGEPYDSRAYRLLADPKHKKTYKIDRNRYQRKGILSEDEALKLVHASGSVCYQAFFSVLFESGMRSGEAFSLRVRDVERHENGYYTLHIQRSKTIKRPVSLYGSCTNYLRKWLAQHPERNNPDAPLWYNTEGNPLNNFAANKELKRLLRVVGIKRAKISLHSFRHSCATLWAQRGISEFKMCKHFGWKIGSKMPATYINDAALDARDAARQVAGLPAEESEVVQIGRRCLHCEHKNAQDATHCDICGLPLDTERLRQVKEAAVLEKEKDALVEALMRQLEERFGKKLEALMDVN